MNTSRTVGRKLVRSSFCIVGGGALASGRRSPSTSFVSTRATSPAEHALRLSLICKCTAAARALFATLSAIVNGFAGSEKDTTRGEVSEL